MVNYLSPPLIDRWVKPACWCCRTHKRQMSLERHRKHPYLASFFLPKDSRRWVALRAAEEGHGATRSRDLVPWSDDHLGRHWRREKSMFKEIR